MPGTPFAVWLARQLDERAWSVMDAARHLHINHGAISRYLAGKSLPSLATLRTIAVGFGVPLADLERIVSEQDGPENAAHGLPLEAREAELLNAFSGLIVERLSERAKKQIIDIIRTDLDEQADPA
jgi:transcriptional regulator with XRE-family HTH domain